MDPNIFFPKGHTDHYAYYQARKVCDGCPVNDECLAEAMRFEGQDSARAGMWGGFTPDERSQLRRVRRAARKVA